MDLIRLGRFFNGPLPGVLNTQGRCDNGHVIHAAPAFRFKDHAGDFRINGHFGHHAAPGCQDRFTLFSNERPQFHQQVKSVFDASGVGFIKEWKVRNVSEIQGNHAEDDLREVGSQNFRIREFLSGFVVFL